MSAIIHQMTLITAYYRGWKGEKNFFYFYKYGTEPETNSLIKHPNVISFLAPYLKERGGCGELPTSSNQFHGGKHDCAVVDWSKMTTCEGRKYKWFIVYRSNKTQVEQSRSVHSLDSKSLFQASIMRRLEWISCI